MSPTRDVSRRHCRKHFARTRHMLALCKKSWKCWLLRRLRRLRRLGLRTLACDKVGDSMARADFLGARNTSPITSAQSDIERPKLPVIRISDSSDDSMYLEAGCADAVQSTACRARARAPGDAQDTAGTHCTAAPHAEASQLLNSEARGSERLSQTTPPTKRRASK